MSSNLPLTKSSSAHWKFCIKIDFFEGFHLGFWGIVTIFSVFAVYCILVQVIEEHVHQI